MSEKDINTYKVKIALLTDKNIELQQRIDNAIEYIKENKASLPMGRDDFTCEIRYSDDVVLAHKILEILGNKENE